MAKDRLTVYLDPEVAQALRVTAARRKMKDSALVEEAVKEWIGLAAFERAWDRNTDLTEGEAMELALEAQREVREERRRQREQAPS